MGGAGQIPSLIFHHLMARVPALARGRAVEAALAAAPTQAADGELTAWGWVVGE